jgi:hypothetical protein
VKRFFIVDPQIGKFGIRDLTETAREFVLGIGSWNDKERQEYPELIREWFSSGRYVFYWDSTDFYMNAHGYVESS